MSTIRSTIGMQGERKTIAWCPCKPPLTMETFGEKSAPRLVMVARGDSRFTEEETEKFMMTRKS